MDQGPLQDYPDIPVSCPHLQYQDHSYTDHSFKLVI